MGLRNSKVKTWPHIKVMQFSSFFAHVLGASNPIVSDFHITKDIIATNDYGQFIFLEINE